MRFFFGPKCADEAIAKDFVIKGIVINKFFDESNHNVQAIAVNSRNDVNKYLLVDLEDSLLWKKIKIKDSISKDKNSLVYYLFRGKVTDTITLTFNCEK